MRLFCIIALAAVSFAQPLIQRIDTTPQQALITYTPGTAGFCTIAVSESESMTPLHADIDPARYANSNRDDQNADRTPEGRGTNTRRTFVAGTRINDRSLAAAATYYARVSCESKDSPVMKFETRRISGIAPRELPFDPSAHGNWGVPGFGPDRRVPIVDPTSGARAYRATDPNKMGHQKDWKFLYQSAPNWSNAQNLLSDSTGSLAQVSTTDPAFLGFEVSSNDPFYMGGFNLKDSYLLSNIRVRVHGSGSSATAADRQVQICLTVDSGQSCYTTPITVTLPQSGANTQSIPSEFPGFGFAGWSRPVPKEYWAVGKSNGMTVNGTSATLAADGNQNFASQTFRREYVPGSKVFIANSTCPNQVCTLAAVTAHNAATLVESTTVSNVQWRMYHFGIRVVKANANGKISVSFGNRVVGTAAHHAPSEESISAYTVKAGANEMRFTLWRDYRNGPNRLGVCSEKEAGDCRLLSHFRVPNKIPGHADADLPKNAGFSHASQISIDQTTPGVFYTAASTGNGTKLFRLTYKGDLAEIADGLMSPGGAIAPADNTVTWENLGRTGQPSIASQLEALPGYDANYWGKASPRFVGIAKGYALFDYLPFGQDREGWLISVQLSDGKLVWARNTRNDLGNFSGSCVHAASTADLFIVNLHGRIAHYGGCASTGRFDAAVTHVFRAAAWSNNTAVPWPPDATYERACPADIDQAFKDRGAVGNRCVQLRFAAEPCIATSAAPERAAFPCGGNPNGSSLGRPLRPGDSIIDAARGVDSETMMLVKRTGLDMTFLRDEWIGYACIENDTERNRGCAATAGQGTHAAGWTASIYPSNANIYLDPETGALTEENNFIIRGHLEHGPRPNNLRSFVGIDAAGRYVGRLNAPQSANGTRKGLRQVAYLPRFAGLDSADQQGSTQSYVTVPGTAATDIWGSIGVDYRHMNGSSGAEHEVPSQGLGAGYKLTLQPGTTSVYEIGPITGTLDKRRPWLWLWAGHYVLGEKSGPATGDSLTDADAWRFCRALAPNECRTGSTPGKVYAVIPGARIDSTQCRASQVSTRVPCAFSPASLQGQLMQIALDADDPEGLRQRSVGMGITRPGAQYVYSKGRPWPSGQRIHTTAFHVGGWWSGPVMIDPGQWEDSPSSGVQWKPVPIKVPASSYVEFGYNSSFHCAGRSEACRATAPTIGNVPYLFAAESGSAVAKGQATVAVPAISGRVLYLRVVTGGAPGPIQVIAVP